MLCVVKAHQLPSRPTDQHWLVEHLWGEEAVGVLGGEPKCYKSFLALDLAVSVASGRPCLGRFSVARPGRALLFAAEDALWDVRQRLDGIAHAAQVALLTLDIHVITNPVVRLDLDADREKLEATVAALRPRLVILDPFVRLHRVDENVVSEVAPLLAYLRGIQRRYHTAVLLVHHARKGAAHMRAGQALRGSSELHAWGDSNLYMRRRSGGVTLTVEHRNAPSIAGLGLEFIPRGDAASLQITQNIPTADEARTARPLPVERVATELRKAGTALSLRQVRAACQMRSETASTALEQLVQQGRAERTKDGFRIVRTGPSHRSPIPAPS